MVAINQVLVPLCKVWQFLPFQMVVIFKIRNLFFYWFDSGFIFFSRIVYLLIKYRPYTGPIVVTARKIKDTFPKHLPSVLALYSNVLYSNVCQQNFVTNSFYPLNLLTYLTDMWYNIQIVEVLIVQIADYMELWNDSSYVHSILKYSDK